MIILLKISLILFWCACYAIGGQGKKWVRRFLGAGVFGLGVATFGHFALLALIAGAWYVPSLVIFKYGVNDGSTLKKVVMRAVYGASLGLSGLLAGISSHHAALGLAQLVMATLGSVYFGVANPFGSRWGNWSTIWSDVCIALLAVGMVPFIL